MRADFYAVRGSILNRRYIVHDIVGTGATAIVLACQDTKTKDKKAVKRFFKEKLTKPLERRICSEPRLNLRSNYVVKANEYFYDGYLNLVMPYVEGQTLRDILDTHGSLDKAHALYTALCLAQAVCALYAAQIASTDIKPENIIISNDGIAKLIDITCYEEINNPPLLSQGTEPYASRELLERRCLTSYTDIYSIAVVLCEMLFGMENLEKMLVVWDVSIKTKIMPSVRHIEKEHPDLAPIIEKSITPYPNDRYKNANELFNDLLSAYTLITGQACQKEKRFVLVCRNGKELSIKKGTIVLGRNDVDSVNFHISEKHFEIEFDGDSLVRIRDKGSTNGTVVNGKRVNKRWKRLYDTDIIQIANVQMKVRL